MLYGVCLVVCIVLADPHKKAIYDTTGIKGLETDGWEVLNLFSFFVVIKLPKTSIDLYVLMGFLMRSFHGFRAKTIYIHYIKSEQWAHRWFWYGTHNLFILSLSDIFVTVIDLCIITDRLLLVQRRHKRYWKNLRDWREKRMNDACSNKLILKWGFYMFVSIVNKIGRQLGNCGDTVTYCAKQLYMWPIYCGSTAQLLGLHWLASIFNVITWDKNNTIQPWL